MSADHADGEASACGTPRAEVTVEFFGGLRVIGSSKILISTERARVFLDMGMDIPAETDLFRAPVQERTHSQLRDRLAVEHAPAIPGLYDPAQLAPNHPLAEPDTRETAVFISHAHIDHDGALGFIRDDIPVYGHPDTARLERALFAAGQGSAQAAAMKPITGVIEVGDLRVEAVPVDHDIPGACGYLVHTPDGTLAYTGDLNFHRDAGERSHAFERVAHGCRMLVTETTLLSFDGVKTPPPEAQLRAEFGRQLRESPGLALVSLYERDLGRATAFIREAAAQGRTLVWPAAHARFLAGAGVGGVHTWDGSRPQRGAHAASLDGGDRDTRPGREDLTADGDLARRGPGSQDASAGGECAPAELAFVSLQEVAAAPSKFVIQPDAHDPAALLDLPLHRGAGPDAGRTRAPGESGSDADAYVPFIHSQGEPLGPFMPQWDSWQAWLKQLGITYVANGSSGHAPGEELVRMVEEIAPSVVVPIHGFRPEALRVDIPVLLAEYGVKYRLDGTRLE